MTLHLQPIPLELLLISAPDEDPSSAKSSSRNKSVLSKNLPHAPVIPIKEAKGGYSITFVHLGRKYYQMTLWASTYVSQRKWVENITRQQDLMRERSQFFETVTLSEGFFVGTFSVNCAAPFSKYHPPTFRQMLNCFVESRPRSSSSLWDVRWRLHIQSLGAASGANESPCADGCDTSGCARRISAPHRSCR